MITNLIEPLRRPDILDCIANLSSDEVFTPPSIANQVLDLLPAEIWTDPKIKILDPCAKSGVFLREAVKRLMTGLAAAIPDEDERRAHIFKNMLYGIAITEITGLISRRSLYYSKDASSEWSVSGFNDEQGNVHYSRGKHVYKAGKCVHCNAPEGSLDRGEHLENYAYQFIHKPLWEIFSMKFDVIIGNPPYQLEDEGHGASAAPIYQKFVEQAKKLNPRYFSMIIPARWYSGGKGLDSFRAEMLGDKRIKVLVDYPKLYDAFPGVKIRGGICYFLWDREHKGKCRVQTMWDGLPLGAAVERYLDEYDVLVRRNEAVSILKKIKEVSAAIDGGKTLDQIVSSRKPFDFPTTYHGAGSRSNVKEPTKFYGSQKITWIERSTILRNLDWVHQWKVLMTRVQGTSAAVETKYLSNPIISGPGEACSETYLVVGPFSDKETAEYCAAYLRTRFARFLVSLRKATQDAAKDVYAFIPLVPLDRVWTDKDLYDRYGLTGDEIAFVEDTVFPMLERDADENEQ